MATAAAPPRDRLPRFALAAAFLLVSYGIVVAASLCDDAYITLRTVDHFVHGYGLRWNIDERVQTFTHPLWLFALTSVYVFTREAYYTTLAVSIVCAVASLVLLARLARTPMTAALVILVAGSSHAFIGYSTTGLENPLSNLLLALYAGQLFLEPRSQRRLFWLAFLSALLLLNRLDYALLLAPSLAYESWRLRGRKTMVTLLLGFIPLFAWESFSVVYYGSFVPNTAHAKLTNQFPRGTLVAHGFKWAWFTLSRDWATVLVVVTAGAGAVWQRRSRGLTCAIGCLAYVAYTIYIGGDFMGGRFWLAPFFFALSYLAQCPLPLTRWIATAIVASALFLPVRTAAFGGFPLDTIGDTALVWDDRAFYAQQDGLVRLGLHARGPLRQWATTELDAHKSHVVILRAVGMQGYWAGVRTHIIDPLALADPLLARLHPLPDPTMAPGHLFRAIPNGYVSSIKEGHNVIVEPHLHEFYDRLSTVIRDPIFAPARLWTTLQLVSGRYQRLLRDYEASPAAAEAIKLADQSMTGQ